MDLANNFLKERFLDRDKPLENDWTRRLDEADKKIEKLIHEREVYKKDAALKERALEIACEDVVCLSTHNICAMVDLGYKDNNDSCDLDHGECLKTYYLKQAQWHLDAGENNKVVKGEGR